MHDVIDSPMAGREKTVTAGAADFLRASRTGVLTLGPEVEAEAIANCFAAKRGTSRASVLVAKTFPSAFRGLMTAGKYTAWHQQPLSSLF